MIRVFRHYISPVKLALMGADFIFLAAIAFLVVRFDFPLMQNASTFVLADLLIELFFSSLVVAGMLAVGCYASDSVRSFRNFVIRFVLVLLVATLMVAGFLFFIDYTSMVRKELVYVSLSSLVLVPFLHWMVMGLIVNASLKLKIVIIGDDAQALEIQSAAKEAKEIGVEVVGIVCLSQTTFDQRSENEAVHLYSEIDDFSGFVRGLGAETIIPLASARQKENILADLIACKMDGMTIQDLTSFYEQAFGYVDIDSLKDEWIIFADGFKGSSFFEYWLKRLSDITVSSLMLLLASPLMIIAAILVKVTSKGPLFYVQERVGYGGKSFDLFKFRTMTVTAEQDGPQWAQENDPRVTAVGGFFRRTRIDELPQILNVLRGDMSFVGPRPERPFFVDQFNKSIPFYQERHFVKPGITGWAQLRYPYGASEEDAKRKLEYDLYYIKNYSIFLDVLIILQTVRVILFPSGVR
ncbi:TIGR03013 family PEP-CTERM/XrtA system glycosyltransferase [Temperatibacter marinus]|uniref:TIGR03013 family PEP-CTERM/XrtA system glycosyltransferase n=1 Tax=Temperatibacter marinus TaxID=1456591 RepID=A0AA52EC20_9PROT|nr:TIGR03013 family XrtA/PEP-CTERM system glycosyltransferase [Temperatibacter marinus]WND02612.1 TIGR03013 family PEP-CTERM/XrtA system glycosyltransferase [Temperatibacter marinus]